MFDRHGLAHRWEQGGAAVPRSYLLGHSHNIAERQLSYRQKINQPCLAHSVRQVVYTLRARQGTLRPEQGKAIGGSDRRIPPSIFVKINCPMLMNARLLKIQSSIQMWCCMDAEIKYFRRIDGTLEQWTWKEILIYSFIVLLRTVSESQGNALLLRHPVQI